MKLGQLTELNLDVIVLLWVDLGTAPFHALQFTGTVMTSFNHVMITTQDDWFQRNPLDHESDDHADSLCV